MAADDLWVVKARQPEDFAEPSHCRVCLVGYRGIRIGRRDRAEVERAVRQHGRRVAAIVLERLARRRRRC